MNAELSIVSGVAGRYATALFETARDEGALDRVAGELDQIDRLIAESEDLRRLVRSPVFSTEQQVKALTTILDRAGIAGIAANFVKLVAANRRLFALPEMIEDFRRLLAQHRGEVVAEVTTASALTEEQAGTLSETLSGSLGKRIRLVRHVDPSLIGGLVVRVGSRMIDTSLRTKLNSLRLAMKEVG